MQKHQNYWDYLAQTDGFFMNYKGLKPEATLLAIHKKTGTPKKRKK
jgi:hypothetical protein